MDLWIIVHRWIRATSLRDICLTIKAHGDYRRNHMLCYKHMGARCNLIKWLESAFCLDTNWKGRTKRQKRKHCKAQTVALLWKRGTSLRFFLAFLIKIPVQSSFTTCVLRVCGLTAPHCPSKPQGGSFRDGEKRGMPVRCQPNHKKTLVALRLKDSFGLFEISLKFFRRSKAK